MRIEAPLPRKKARLEIIPLIDIMFFLLATFIMVSLSMIQNRGLTVALPAASAAVAQAAPSVVLGLTAQGALYWDKQPIGAADLPGRLASLKASDPDPKVILQADSRAAYGDVVRVLDQVKAAGITKAALRTRGPAAP